MKSAPSSEHSKMALLSLENARLAEVVEVCAGGPESMVVWGAVVSTVHAHCAGVASTLPVRSRARTANECAASARPRYSSGEGQALNAAPLSEHSKVPGSVEETAKPADVLPVRAGGPESIVVSGASASGGGPFAPDSW